MGKFMRKNRRADVAVMVEGLLGVRTRASEAQNRKSHHQAEEFMENPQPAKKRCSSSGGEIVQEHRNPGQEEGIGLPQQQEEELSEKQQEIESSGELEREEDEELEQLSLRSQIEATSRLLLRESHSDSCLRRASDACPITAHSRSNSASFTQDQLLSLLPASSENAGKAPEQEDEDQVREEPSSSPTASTKEVEPSCDDNTLVLFRAMKRSNPQEPEVQPEVQPEVEAPGLQASTSRSSVFQRSQRRRRTPEDCGPGWRHRVANTPSADELEEFFTGVEQGKGDRIRFQEKYNFDVFNDVPLPGRFEWVHLQP